jgi:hypothetical protein
VVCTEFMKSIPKWTPRGFTENYIVEVGKKKKKKKVRSL